MTWPIAVFASIATIVLSALTLFLVVYYKEYNREEKIMKQGKGDMDKLLASIPVYVLPTPPAPKKKKVVKDATTTLSPTKDDKGDKGLN